MKNASQNTSRKINGVLDTYLQETLGGQEKPLQKTRERREKIEETWVGTEPKKTRRPSYEAEKITIINENIYNINI